MISLTAPIGVDYTHSRDRANAIQQNGLDEVAARGATKGGQFAEPGSFFSFEISPSDTEGMQLADEMGLRQSESECVVLICHMPSSVVDEIEGAGLMRTSPIPGTDVSEMVFKPRALARINAVAQSQLVALQ